MPRQPVAPIGKPGLSRRTFLKGSVAASAAVVGGGVMSTALRPSRVRAADTPIEHIIVACQENRSFDHYYGYAPQVQAAGFGPPPGYSQPNPGGTPDQRARRDLLRREMEKRGFTVFPSEWWHFDYRDWRAYSIQNVAFEQIARLTAPERMQGK